MARGLIRGAMQGLGAATETVGIEAMKAAILAARDERVNSYQSARDDKMMAHTSAEAKLGRDLTSKESGLSRDHATTLQSGSFAHAEKLQGERITADSSERAADRKQQTGEKAADRAQQTAENNKNRELEGRRIGIQGAQLGLAMKQFKLAYEKGEIELNQLRRVETLHKEYLDQDTKLERREQIADSLYDMQGKSRVLVTKHKDADGVETDVVRNARSGRLIGDGASGAGNDPLNLRKPGVTAKSAENKATPTQPQSSATVFGASDFNPEYWIKEKTGRGSWRYRNINTSKYITSDEYDRLAAGRS